MEGNSRPLREAACLDCFATLADAEDLYKITGKTPLTLKNRN